LPRFPRSDHRGRGRAQPTSCSKRRRAARIAFVPAPLETAVADPPGSARASRERRRGHQTHRVEGAPPPVGPKLVDAEGCQGASAPSTIGGLQSTVATPGQDAEHTAARTDRNIAHAASSVCVRLQRGRCEGRREKRGCPRTAARGQPRVRGPVGRVAPSAKNARTKAPRQRARCRPRRPAECRPRRAHAQWRPARRSAAATQYCSRAMDRRRLAASTNGTSTVRSRGAPTPETRRRARSHRRTDRDRDLRNAIPFDRVRRACAARTSKPRRSPPAAHPAPTTQGSTGQD